MNTPRDIETKIDQTLASLDGVQRAQSNPFLFTRIKAQLEENEKAGFWPLLNKPAMAFAAVLFIILMNSLVFFQSSETPAATVQEDDQVFATEYTFALSTADKFYSINEEQQ